MDFSGQKANSIRSDDTSLGLLNMDSLKGRGRFFGDLSHDSTGNRNAPASNGVDRRISDRLNMERKKAIETLQKSGKSDLNRRSPASSNKENIKSVLNNASTNSSIPLDRTDYVPFRRPHTINISDLVTDETINLETTSCPPSAAKDTKISFEPSEITGRSTLYKKDLRNQRYTAAPAAITTGVDEGGSGKRKTMSVSDILASSFAQKARNLCDSLNGGDCSLNTSAEDGQLPRMSLVSSSTTCSSFTNYNDSKSLPRTADLSLSKASYLSFTADDAGTFSFNCGVGAGAGDESYTSSENFAPGELMESKLIMDEISWAQEYAAIPTATLSEQAKAKAAERTPQVNTNGFEPPSASNSIIAGDPNFSVGNFFHMRSENIWDIVKSISPDKCRTPIALLDEEDVSTGTVSTSSIQMKRATSLVKTPQVDNKTYTRVSSQTNACQESKDSGNSSDNSYLLSVSAIDKALTSLQRDSRTSGYDNSSHLFMLTKKSKSCMNPKLSNAQAVGEARYSRSRGTSLAPDIKLSGAKSHLQAVSEIILENKENLDPEMMRSSENRSELSETLSFTESILNSSDMKQMEHSHSQQRSPLSPIEVRSAPNIRVTDVTDGEEADNDEWPGTPVQNPNRRIRRTKSPHNKTPLCANAAAEESEDATTPVNSRSSRSYVADKMSITGTNNSKEPKSLCSTRLDGERNDCDLGISPNLSATKTSGLLERNNTLTNASPGQYNMDNSPLSIPSRSYHLAQSSSPTPTNLDTTSNSDCQLRTAGVAQKVVSSPVGSETSSTCSYATMHSTRSATTGAIRSISRCSSTSEFSHRDGKPIPLKVTAFELSWGSVKLRSDSQKCMQIKNIINKRLVIRMEVSGPGFQIVNNQGSNNITLQSQECRTINISFCPTVPGVAIGKLSFFAPTGTSTICQSFVDVALYGYGGSANVMPQKVTIGPVGSPFITMGDICELAHPLQRTVRFQNKGPLLAFAVITVDSLGLMLPRISDAFEIQPQKVLIPSRNSVDVQILFKPKREEIRKILKKIGSVLALATLRVISGDEANRQRIRRLLVQMNEQERSKMSSSTLDMMWTTFPGEEEMRDLTAIRESPNIAMDLTTGCRVHEIVLTINRENFDETAEASSLFLPDADDSVLFRTVICAADSNSPTPPPSLGTISEMYEENTDDGNGFTAAADKKASWAVKPSFVEINLKRPEHVSLFVFNGFKSRQYFEVICSKKNLLRFSPTEGYVAPDNGQTEIVIEVNVNAARDLQEDVFITVNMENERIMVPVKIL